MRACVHSPLCVHVHVCMCAHTLVCVCVCVCVHVIVFVWFGLVSLFNGISTLFRLFNAKAILLEEQ